MILVLLKVVGKLENLIDILHMTQKTCKKVIKHITFNKQK